MTASLTFDPATIAAIAEAVAKELRGELANGHGVRARLLSVAEAAVYIGRSPEAVRHLVRSGQLPVVKPDGRVSLDIEDLDRWIADHKRPAEGG